MKSSKIVLAIAAVLAVSPVFAQEGETPKQDAAVLGFGSFLSTTTNNGIQHSADNTGGVLATYRYFFDRHNGVEVNYAYSDYTSRYGLGGSLASVETRSHESSAAYVFRFPMKRITPFVLAGAGGIVFDPNNFAGAGVQARPAFLYGAGVDFNLARRFFMRAEYRGLVYNSPTWGLPVVAGLDRLTHNAEPAFGFGYRF